MFLSYNPQLYVRPCAISAGVFAKNCLFPECVCVCVPYVRMAGKGDRG